MIGRAGRRRLWLGGLTLLGIPRGFFLPYRYAATLPPPGTRPSYAAAERRLAACASRFRELLTTAGRYADVLYALGSGPAPAPRWDQSWFPRLDAAIAYALVRESAPRRIVEVGAGHSTRFLARAVADGRLETAITAIDPMPRADLATLPVTLLRAPLQQVDADVFAGLAAHDMLLVDSSHLLMPGSDVDFLLGHVVPELASGVLVQLHDVFLPDDYPAEWAWRGYNEQLGVLQLLLGELWEPVFASHYVATRLSDAVAASPLGGLPLVSGARESSLWLRRR